MRAGDGGGLGEAGLKRGEIVTAALAGDYGKPRPCLVVQSDRLADLDSVLVCPLTSNLTTTGPTRLMVAATSASGLVVDSLVMIDKITAVPRARCRDTIGTVGPKTMEQASGLLLLVLGCLD